MVEYEIAILARGGQGGVTLGKILAYTASYDGLYASAIPKYGAERRGAPISTSVRIYDRPIKKHAQIEKPTDVISLDMTLVPRMYPEDPFKGEGTLTVNSAHLGPEYDRYNPSKIGVCNIQHITKEVGLVKAGSAMIGIPTLGAFLRTSNMLSMGSLHKAIDKMFKGSSYLDANHQAVDRTHSETEVIEK